MAGKLKFAGEREKMVGTSLNQGSVAFLRGLLEGKRKSGTRGIVKARTMPTLERSSNKAHERRPLTYATHKANTIYVVCRLVRNDPQQPRSLRFHALKHSRTDSILSARLLEALMSRSSDFFHSGPRAGTVTNSTSFGVNGSSSLSSDCG